MSTQVLTHHLIQDSTIMAKNPIKVMPTVTGTIIAGRVNPKTNMFTGVEEDVTETALQAVALHLLMKKFDYHFTIKGKKYRNKKYILKVEEVE